MDALEYYTRLNLSYDECERVMDAYQERSDRSIIDVIEDVLFYRKDYTSMSLPSGWEHLSPELSEVSKILSEETCTIYPPVEDVFTAFSTSPESIRVVVLGQDPYHSPGAAMGVAFGHRTSRNKVQYSLKRIYGALEYDSYSYDPDSGDLTKWVEQGVFLINTALTVRKGEPDSHADIWRPFTDRLMRYLNSLPRLVVILWGGKAKRFDRYFDDRHHIIPSHHPAYARYNKKAGEEFRTHRPFSRANDMLTEWGYEPIDWNLI